MRLKKAMVLTLAAAMVPLASMAEITRLQAAPQAQKGVEQAGVVSWPASITVDENMIDRSAEPVQPLGPRALQSEELGQDDAPVIDALTQIFIDGFAPGWDANWAGPYGGGYDGSGVFHNWRWAERTERSSVGSYAAYCAGYAAEIPNPSVDTYPDDMTTWMYYGPVDMSAYDGAMVRFDIFVDCEARYDNAFVGISTDGSNFEGRFYSGYDAAWHTDEEYMIEFPGGATQVYFLFKFHSDYTVSSHEGNWVDQVRIYGYNPDPVPLPSDLRITDIYWSPFNPAPGATVNVSVEYENNGLGASGPFYIDLFSDTDGVAPSIGQIGNYAHYNAAGLAPGASTFHTFSYTYPDHGTRWITALIDTDEIVDESNENNNTWLFEKLPVGIATVINAGAVSPNPVPAGGASIVFPVTALQYTGSQTRPAWVTVSYEGYGNSVELYVSPGNITLTPGFPLNANLTFYIPSTAPGGRYQINVNFGNYPWLPWDSGRTGFTKNGPVANSLRDFEGVEFKMMNADAFELAADETSELTSLPAEFALGTAYPNPFNPSTTLSVALPAAAELNVTVYNVQGQQVATLASGQYQAGNHQLVFDARGLASGVYLVQAQTSNGNSAVQKVMLMK